MLAWNCLAAAAAADDDDEEGGCACKVASLLQSAVKVSKTMTKGSCVWGERGGKGGEVRNSKEID